MGEGNVNWEQQHPISLAGAGRMQWDDGNERLGRRHALDILDSTKQVPGFAVPAL
jgi:hypothetical protein